jgi:hypothetical protein
MENTIDVPETKALTEVKQEVVNIEAQAHAVAQAIHDDVTLKAAADFLFAIKRGRKRVEDFIGPMVKKAHAAWKEAVAKEKELDEPLEKAERLIIKPAMARYQTEMERKRQQEAERLAAIEREKEEKARIERAAEIEKAGDKEAAEQVMNTPTPIAPIIQPASPKIAGISYREKWTFIITNPALIPREYLMADERKIGGIVSAMKSETNIPGVVVSCEKVVSGRI